MVPLYESGGKVVGRRIATVLYLLGLATAVALQFSRMLYEKPRDNRYPC
jgi:hypothetical protein